MTTNYKENLEKLSKKELIERAVVTPDLVEKTEVERLGGIHLTDINGPDGTHDDYGYVEVKSQRWRGCPSGYKLRGRAKFGNISETQYERKVEEDELIVNVGYDENNGTLFYRMTFRFAAIAEKYAEDVEKSKDKNWSNCDVLPKHFKDHETFNVEYVANGKVLEENSEAFTPSFYKFLQSYNYSDK